MSKTILITGATDGIGLALAQLVAKIGHRPILHGRRPLEEQTDPLFRTCPYIQADLSKADCAKKIVSGLAEHDIRQIDLLIHNAGTGYKGPLSTQSAESIRDLVQINYTAPVLLTHALLPLMPKGAQIIFVGSVVTALPTPDYAVYGATKAALRGFARSLRIELAGKIRVQMIHPGATRTGMHHKIGIANPKTARYPSAEKVAKGIWQAIANQKRETVIGRTNQLLWSLGQTSPSPFDWLLRAKRRPQPRQTHAPLRVAITGGADGIGKALMIRYAKAGYQIIGIDNDNAQIAQTSAELYAMGADFRFISADLSLDWEWVEQLPPVDIFIHNAGISATGHFRRSNPARQATVIAVNLLAPLVITAKLLQEQKLQIGGSLLFLSSLSHFVSYPSAAVYAGTKDGLAHFGRTLHVAQYPQNHVLTIFPGPTRTAHAHRYSPDNRNEARRMAPAMLADLIFKAQQAKKKVLLPGLAAKVMARVGRNFPQSAEKLMKRTLLDKFPTPSNDAR